MSLVEKIFGTYSSKQIKKIEPIVNKIEALADKFSKMSDGELAAKTPEFKERLAAGETLDDILPEAFATVREAATRVLGKRPFRVQIMGGIILHQGRIAEMKTGEGKTLVATMPAYLNALTEKGVHIVTVNDYLARRDSEEMGKIYAFLGLTTGLIVHGQTSAEKKAAYACDITYGTNNEIGFDYLRDNMVIYKDRIVQRGHNFAIVDEVDSILVDEARTPLIISGPGNTSDEMYGKADAFVRTLKGLRIKEKDTKSDYEDVTQDYIVDEKAKRATLTKHGIAKAEAFFGIENYADLENTDLNHYVNQALHAHGVMKLDVDYVVMDGKVLIVDSFTGRIMPGRRFSDGLHQAIEAKERVKIENENQTQATITFQNLFRLYKKLSGMTGTALTEEEEFREIYSLDVVEVPTNRPMIRKDRNDVVYKNQKGKYDAIIAQIKECHEKGQPVLVGTVSVDKSEFLSKLLNRAGVKHNVLNAKYHEKEAEIVAQAGKYGAVTISTNMAGRGTDIMLGGNAEFLAKNELKKLGYSEEEIFGAMGASENIDEKTREAREIYREKLAAFKEQIAPEAEKVREAGGLFILGTERHESRRIDNQLRGRAGRQGDPGESRFFLSLEDDLLRLFGSERIQGMVEHLGLPDDQPIDAKILSGTIENAQKRLEGENFNRRKNVLDYDDVMNQQRNIIYGERRRVLDGEDISETIVKMMDGAVADGIAASVDTDKGAFSVPALRKNLFWLIAPDDFAGDAATAEEASELLLSRAHEVYAKQQEVFGEHIRELERVALLTSVDRHWMEHLDAMDDLRGGVGLAAYAQRNPLNEYRLAAGDMFDGMIADIRVDTVRMVLFSRPAQQIQRVQVAKQQAATAAAVGGEAAKKRPVVKKAAEKIGRNDPCPCGSGKKYKKCCGANGSADEN
ncbi:MAG: preprotein translocase subunit SecA [Ruminococcaceae bacterium]|nr:preprotein translocase subunit SecA [Oscillospiraceae bacterium]